jgi:Na+-driven multidrug efflux pump
MGWGVYGAWIGLSGEVALATLVLWRRLNGTAWHKASSAAPPLEVAPVSA